MAPIVFDKRRGLKPDGSPDLAVGNMKEKDGLVIFPVKEDGSLGEADFTDAGEVLHLILHLCTAAMRNL